MPWSLRIPPKPPPPLHPFHSPPQGGVPSPIGYPSLFYPLFESMRRYVNPVISHRTLLVLSIKVECTCDDKSYAMVTRSLKIVTVVSKPITFSLKNEDWYSIETNETFYHRTITFNYILLYWCIPHGVRKYRGRTNGD